MGRVPTGRARTTVVQIWPVESFKGMCFLRRARRTVFLYLVNITEYFVRWRLSFFVTISQLPSGILALAQDMILVIRNIARARVSLLLRTCSVRYVPTNPQDAQQLSNFDSIRVPFRCRTHGHVRILRGSTGSS